MPVHVAPYGAKRTPCRLEGLGPRCLEVDEVLAPAASSLGGLCLPAREEPAKNAQTFWLAAIPLQKTAGDFKTRPVHATLSRSLLLSALPARSG